MSRCKFFFSGLVSYRDRLDAKGIVGFRELLSYWEYHNRKKCFEEINELATKRSEIMIDSGAYSAYNSGKVIDMNHFIQWQKTLEKECPEIWIKAGLDDMKDWKKSIENQNVTDAAGIKLFPTYHEGEPEEYFDWVASGKYPLIGVSPLSDALSSPHKIRAFFDYTYDKLCDSEGKSRLMTHLLGVSSMEFISTYPAYSADAASATFNANYGGIWIPQIDPYTQKFDWAKSLIRICISSDNNSRGLRNQHYLTSSPAQKELIKKFVESYDFSVDFLAVDNRERKSFSLLMQLEQTKNYPENVRFDRSEVDNFCFV